MSSRDRCDLVILRRMMEKQKDETVIKQGPVRHKDTTIRLTLVSSPCAYVHTELTGWLG